MELVVRKNDLLKELSLLQGIVERKNTIPILANVLIEATKDGISLLATDLDVGLRSRRETSPKSRSSSVIDDWRMTAARDCTRSATLSGAVGTGSASLVRVT